MKNLFFAVVVCICFFLAGCNSKSLQIDSDDTSHIKNTTETYVQHPTDETPFSELIHADQGTTLTINAFGLGEVTVNQKKFADTLTSGVFTSVYILEDVQLPSHTSYLLVNLGNDFLLHNLETKSLKDTIIYDILVEFGAISGDICYVHRGVYVINKQENIRGYEIHHLDYQTNPNASCNNNIENLVKLIPEEHKLLHKDWAIKEEKLKEIITLEDESKKVKQTRAPKISDRLKNKICVMYYEKHLTYEQISKKMHCSKSTISNILKNYEYKPKKTNPVKACVEKIVNKLSVLPQKANVIKKGFKANICKTLKNFKESVKKSQILNSSVCRYIYRTYKSSNLNSIILSCYKYVLRRVYHVVKAKPPE